uniref:Endoplasmic reticulum lectin n=1 Tax=Scleropages formosus TaxID=113540 RepID=A0A8C9T8L3_SCLFO
MAASMVRWFRGLYIFFLTCLLPASSFLNLEELNEMKYGIQILPDPVIAGQAKTEDVMLVSNKYKQLYECRLPAQAVRFHQDPAAEPDSQGYSGPGISDLLKPMYSAPCLVKTKDWWTYEFCFGQHVRQYHLEDSEIKGDVLFLGYYDSEFDWNNETAKASKQHRLKRYHSQSYINGSKCDLNGKPRETEVRFLCEEGSGDYIARVDEPQSCRYVLTVHTTRTCRHPFLRPPSSAKPQGIICQPALSPQQYMDYVRAQVCEYQRLSVAHCFLGCATFFPYMVVLLLFPWNIAAERKEGRGKQAKESVGDDEDERLLQEFEDEMADLSVPSEKIEEIKEEMQKEFDNIIDEAQQELETEGLKGEFDRNQATQTLETTLDKLLDRLEDKEAREAGAEGDQEAADPARGSPSLVPHRATDDQVKIRVTKYKPGGSPEQQLKLQEMSEGDPQLQQIKDVVKEQLERAGLKAEGRIEVKILTRRTAEEAGDQWLTEEDTKSFRELLINLLTGGSEEVYKEQKRQQELENNYRFVWGEKQEETQSTGAADSDDVDF